MRGRCHPRPVGIVLGHALAFALSSLSIVSITEFGRGRGGLADATIVCKKKTDFNALYYEGAPPCDDVNSLVAECEGSYGTDETAGEAVCFQPAQGELPPFLINGKAKCEETVALLRASLTEFTKFPVTDHFSAAEGFPLAFEPCFVFAGSYFAIRMHGVPEDQTICSAKAALINSMVEAYKLNEFRNCQGITTATSTPSDDGLKVTTTITSTTSKTTTSKTTTTLTKTSTTKTATTKTKTSTTEPPTTTTTEPTTTTVTQDATTTTLAPTEAITTTTAAATTAEPAAANTPGNTTTTESDTTAQSETTTTVATKAVTTTTTTTATATATKIATTATSVATTATATEIATTTTAVATTTASTIITTTTTSTTAPSCNDEKIQACKDSGGAMCQESGGLGSVACVCKSGRACKVPGSGPGCREGYQNTWFLSECPKCTCERFEQVVSKFKETDTWLEHKYMYRAEVEKKLEPDALETEDGLMAYVDEQYAISSIEEATGLTVNDMLEGAFDNEIYAVLFKLAFTKIDGYASDEGRRERRLPEVLGPALPAIQIPGAPVLKRGVRGVEPPCNASADDEQCAEKDVQLCEHPLVGEFFQQKCPYLCGLCNATTSTTTPKTTTTVTTRTTTTITTTTITATTTTTIETQKPGKFLVDPKTGYILAQPEIGGTYHAELLAVDKGGKEVTLFDWNFTVKLRPEMTVTWAEDPPQGTLNETFEMEPPTVVAIGKAGNSRLEQSELVYRIVSSDKLPEGMDLDLGNGKLYGKPSSAGIFNITIMATDLNSSDVNIVKSVRVNKNKTQTHSVTLVVDECTDALSCSNHGSCDTLTKPSVAPGVYDASLYDGNFTCICNDGWAGTRCEQEASLSSGTAVGGSIGTAVGGSVGGLLGLLFAASLLVAWRAYQRSIAPVDFQAKFQDMVAAGELTGFVAEDANDEGTGLPREIKRSAVTLVERLGKGAFGDVWKGMLDESKTGGAPGYLVAAKTVLDEGASNEAATEELVQEAIVMSKVGAHENLVSVIGAITSGTPLILLLSFCEHGSFLSLLKRSAKPENDSLATGDRLEFAAGVARGMAHLISKRFVHRDLAARNCLVATGMIAKVADFGLSRSGVSSSGYYYYRSQSGVFPVRWTAPEAMATMKFTAASDVWSFGIVLMEAFTDGAKPYGKWKTGAVTVKVMGGYRLPKPETCPENVYTVMSDCWHEDPACRPTFASLAAALEELAIACKGSSTELTESDEVGGSAAVVYKKSLFGGTMLGKEASLSSTADVTKYQQCMYQRVVTTEADKSDANGLPLLQNALPHTPTMSLLDACKLATVHCKANLEHAATTALSFASAVQGSLAVGKKYASLGLSELDIAAVHLYTQETALYPAMNGALGGWGKPDGIRGIPHYVGYIKLLLTALAKLPPVANEEVFRGVRGTPLNVLLNGKGVGDALVWGAFTSTSKSIETLYDPQFFGFGPGLGERVIFHIKIQTGVEIQELSDKGSLFGYADEDEEEVLLAPGTTFIIDAITPLQNDVMQVQMHEVVSTHHQGLAAALLMLPPAPVPVQPSTAAALSNAVFTSYPAVLTNSSSLQLVPMANEDGSSHDIGSPLSGSTADWESAQATLAAHANGLSYHLASATTPASAAHTIGLSLASLSESAL